MQRCCDCMPKWWLVLSFFNFLKTNHSDGFCRSILAPLQFNMINTSIGKVYYHFAKNSQHFNTAEAYCKDFGFGVDLPMPKEKFKYLWKNLYGSYSMSHTVWCKYFLNTIKTAEEVDIFWRIASPLIGEYVAHEYQTFIWMGIEFKDTDWYTLNNENVENLVNSKWEVGTSDDHGANFQENLRILMGRFQVEGSKIPVLGANKSLHIIIGSHIISNKCWYIWRPPYIEFEL